MKKISGTLIAIGFLLLLGTAGTSDLELETKTQIISNTQFWGQMIIGLLLMFLGCISTVVYEGYKTTKKNRQIRVIHSKHSRSRYNT